MTLALRLAQALSESAAGAAAGGHISGDRDDWPQLPVPVEAAVLVPVTDRASPGVILTQRTQNLRRHAGQVAFPGGRLDPGEDAVTAALREAEEEVAMPPAAVTVVGTAETYRTGTGYRITPVVAVVPPDLPLVASEAEVASVFEVPLAFLLDPANHVAARAMWEGKERQFYEILWHDRRIWGATAAMIVNLSRRLAPSRSPAW